MFINLFLFRNASNNPFNEYCDHVDYLGKNFIGNNEEKCSLLMEPLDEPMDDPSEGPLSEPISDHIICDNDNCELNDEIIVNEPIISMLFDQNIFDDDINLFCS